MATSEPLPANVPLTLYRGDTREWSDTITENVGTDEAPDWQPFDLTGWTFLAQIRAGKNRTDELIATMDVDVIDAPGGILHWRLSAEEADKLGDDGKRYWWDLQFTFMDGVTVLHRRTHFAGSVTVKGDASNG